METVETHTIAKSVRDEISNLTIDDIKIGPDSVSNEDPSGDVSEEIKTEDSDSSPSGDDQKETQNKTDDVSDSSKQTTDQNTTTPESAKAEETSSQDSQEVQVDTENIISTALKDAFGVETLDDLKAELDSRAKLKDDFIRSAVEYYEKNGNLTPFLEATQVDYDKMSAEEVLKHKFSKEHQDLPQRLLDKRFANEMKKYNQDEYAEDEDREIGLEEMEFDAKKAREALKKEQQSFLQPQASQEQSSQNQVDPFEYKPQIVEML